MTMNEIYYRLRRYEKDGALTCTIRDVRFHVGVWTIAPAEIVHNGQPFPLAKHAADMLDGSGRHMFDVTGKDGALAIEQGEVARATRAAQDSRIALATGSSVEAADVAPGVPEEDPGAELFTKQRREAELDDAREAEEAKAKIEAKASRAAVQTESEPQTSAQAPATGRRAQRLARRGKG